MENEIKKLEFEQFVPKLGTWANYKKPKWCPLTIEGIKISL